MVEGVPTFYLFVHYKLVATTQVGVKVQYKVVLELLARSFHIPKNVAYCVIKELESFGLVKVHNRLFLEVINRDVSDCVADTSLLYRKVGIQ